MTAQTRGMVDFDFSVRSQQGIPQFRSTSLQQDLHPLCPACRSANLWIAHHIPFPLLHQLPRSRWWQRHSVILSNFSCGIWRLHAELEPFWPRSFKNITRESPISAAVHPGGTRPGDRGANNSLGPPRTPPLDRQYQPAGRSQPAPGTFPGASNAPGTRLWKGTRPQAEETARCRRAPGKETPRFCNGLALSPRDVGPKSISHTPASRSCNVTDSATGGGCRE